MGERKHSNHNDNIRKTKQIEMNKNGNESENEHEHECNGVTAVAAAIMRPGPGRSARLLCVCEVFEAGTNENRIVYHFLPHFLIKAYDETNLISFRNCFLAAFLHIWI